VVVHYAEDEAAIVAAITNRLQVYGVDHCFGDTMLHQDACVRAPGALYRVVESLKARDSSLEGSPTHGAIGVLFFHVPEFEAFQMKPAVPARKLLRILRPNNNIVEANCAFLLCRSSAPLLVRGFFHGVYLSGRGQLVVCIAEYRARQSFFC
jgi:hypothetical protein